ncbi:MAG: hypothetical protein M1838_006230 [Thelocarpon superellum]|nr:MAG: hypothetical protein M1838_006230 [Thelocarpon superellum]
MTRKIVYSIALLAFLTASVMTILANSIPRWISWDHTTPSGVRIHSTYGLHRLCSSLTNTCEPFPQYEDCQGSNRYFCSMWRSVGWMMSFAVVLEGMTLVAYVAIMGGGRQKRETGWKVLSFLMVLTAVVQCASMAIIAYLYDNDERFFEGWRLDTSWGLCTSSWAILVGSALTICVSAWVLPSEGGYELVAGGE